MSLSHREAFNLYQAQLDGRLAPDEEEQLAHHLAMCDECRTDLAIQTELRAAAESQWSVLKPSEQKLSELIRRAGAQSIASVPKVVKRKPAFRRVLQLTSATVFVAVLALILLDAFLIPGSIARALQAPLRCIAASTTPTHTQEPQRIHLLGRSDVIQSEVVSLFVHGNYAYIGGHGCLHVLDISNPAHPRTVSNRLLSTQIQEPVLDVLVAGDYACLAGWMDGFYIADSRSSNLLQPDSQSHEAITG